MALVRVPRPGIETAERDAMFYRSNLCWLCRHLIWEFYRHSYVLAKYCEDCAEMVNILERFYPLSSTDDPFNDPDPELITLNQHQVDDWSECDVCIFKKSEKNALNTHFETYFNSGHHVCALCIAQLGLSVRRQRGADSQSSSSSSSSSSNSSNSSSNSSSSESSTSEERNGLITYDQFNNESEADSEIEFVNIDGNDGSDSSEVNRAMLMSNLR